MPQTLLRYKLYKGIVIVYQHTGFPLLCFPQLSLDRPSSLLPSAQYITAVLAVSCLKLFAFNDVIFMCSK